MVAFTTVANAAVRFNESRQVREVSASINNVDAKIGVRLDGRMETDFKVFGLMDKDAKVDARLDGRMELDNKVAFKTGRKLPRRVIDEQVAGLFSPRIEMDAKVAGLFSPRVEMDTEKRVDDFCFFAMTTEKRTDGFCF